jgi:hypothetical protein
MSGNGTLPEFLQSFENLTAHFEEHFGELGSNERGDTFLGLAEKLIPLTEECQGFPRPEVREKKSHDGGVDLLTAETDDGRVLCAQSKYKIRDKESLDAIVSKFKDFEERLLPREAEPELFGELAPRATAVPTFAILTSSKLQGILKRYEASTLASKDFFDTLSARDARLSSSMAHGSSSCCSSCTARLINSLRTSASPRCQAGSAATVSTWVQSPAPIW